MMIPPFLVRWLIIAAIGVALYAAGRVHQMVIFMQKQDEAVIAGWEEGDKHVANYIRRTEKLAADLAVADRLNRLCQRSLRRTGRPGAAATPDTPDRGADEGMQQLGRELGDVQRNRFQCEALIDTVKPQLYNAPKWWEFWAK